MAEIIDILTPVKNDCSYFIADTTGAVSYVTSAVDPNASRFGVNGDDHSVFSANDHFTILSIGYVLPESFQLWRNQAEMVIPSLDIYLKGNTDGFSYYLPGAYREIKVPLDNFETAIDLFVNLKDTVKAGGGAPLLDQKFSIVIGLKNVAVSMVSQPSAYNGKTMVIIPFVKVLHNQALGD